MKAHELIKILQENPDLDIIVWDGEDNHDISSVDVDNNDIEIVLTI